MAADKLDYILAVVCMLGALTCVFAEWQGRKMLRIASKFVASTAFVAIAASNGALDSNYGRLILTALVLSWFGDVMLLSLRSSMLLGGIGAFFLAHIAFAGAFFAMPIDVMGFLIGLLSMTAVAAVLIRWLWPHLKSFYRIAVPAYLLAIIMMTSLAIGAGSAHGYFLLVIGAVTFAVSDISVARDRFVERSIVNKAWGLPLYYAAQIMFAMSVLWRG